MTILNLSSRFVHSSSASPWSSKSRFVDGFVGAPRSGSLRDRFPSTFAEANFPSPVRGGGSGNYGSRVSTSSAEALSYPLLDLNRASFGPNGFQGMAFAEGQEGDEEEPESRDEINRMMARGQLYHRQAKEVLPLVRLRRANSQPRVRTQGGWEKRQVLKVLRLKK